MKRTSMLLCVLPLVFLAGCAGKETMEVHIEDGQITTVVNVKKGSTVEDVLEAAELTISSEDEVAPAADEIVADENACIMISRKNTITITEDGTPSHTVTITGGKVSDALDNADISIGEYDLINHDLKAYLTDGMEIDIVHRIPVKLTVDGETLEVVTAADTVDELLAEQDIEVGDKDRISKKKDEKLKSGDKLVIERVNVKKVTEKEEIAYETETEYSADMYVGESYVKQEGASGEKEITYEVTYVDGRESGRKLAGEKVITEPTNEIIVQGTKQAEAAPAGAPGKTIVSKEKNYDCDNSGHGWYTITYSDGSVEYIDF